MAKSGLFEKNLGNSSEILRMIQKNSINSFNFLIFVSICIRLNSMKYKVFIITILQKAFGTVAGDTEKTFTPYEASEYNYIFVGFKNTVEIISDYKFDFNQKEMFRELYAFYETSLGTELRKDSLRKTTSCGKPPVPQTYN